MAVAFETLTVDPWEIINVAPGSAVAVKIRTNAGGAIVDAAAGKIFLGTHRVNTKSSVGISLPVTNGATNPTGFQYTADLEYVDEHSGNRKTWNSGWFSFTASTNLAAVVVEQYVPPTYVTQATQQLDAHAADLEADLTAATSGAVASASAAAASASEAETSADAAAASAAEAAARVIEDLGTSDAQMKALIETPSSQTAGALSASIADEVNTPGTDTHDGLLGIFVPLAQRAINLVEAGADNTGVSDAIPALNAAAATGRVIDVPPGTYYLASAWQPTEPVVMKCQPGVVWKGALIEDGLFRPQNVFWMQGGEIDGTGSPTSGPRFGFRIEVPDVTIRDVTVKNTRHFGVFTNAGADRVVFDGLYLKNTGTPEWPTAGGFYSFADGYIKYNNCHVENAQSQGFYLSGTGVVQLNNVSAIGCGAYGIDVRQRGTVSNFISRDNTKGGLNVALQDTGPIQSQDLVITNGLCLSNGPSAASDAFEVSLSNVDRVSLSNIVVESDALTTGVRVQAVRSATFSNCQIRGSHSAYTIGFYVSAGGSIRSRNVHLNNCTIENFNNTGTSVQVDNTDGFYLNGGRLSSSSVGVRYLGAVTDVLINPAAWGGLDTFTRILDNSTSKGNVRVVAPRYSATAAPTSGIWYIGEEINNSAYTAGGTRHWRCTAQGGAYSATWAATTAYAVGTWVRGTSSGTWECVVAGTSGAAQPTGSMGDTVVDGTVTWIKRSNAWATFQAIGPIETSTTAILSNAGTAINTTDKFAGKQVFNTTTGKPVFAAGSTATSVWNDAAGAAAHTPV